MNAIKDDRNPGKIIIIIKNAYRGKRYANILI